VHALSFFRNLFKRAYGARFVVGDGLPASGTGGLLSVVPSGTYFLAGVLLVGRKAKTRVMMTLGESYFRLAGNPRAVTTSDLTWPSVTGGGLPFPLPPQIY
jgi:hypothetical protein